MKNNKINSKLGFATHAIHEAYDNQQGDIRSLNPPIYMTSTFAFNSVEQGAAMFEGEEPGFVYGRVGNPTLDILEKRLAKLEGAEAGLAFASGMGAITSICWTFLQAGDELLCDITLYGCTFAYFTHGLAKFGVKITAIDMTNADNIAAAISDKTKIIYLETPANPNMRLCDIEAISQIAHQADNAANGEIKVVVDNTYCTPYIQRPVELGADIALHSATKYLGGHGDIIAGMAVGSSDDMLRVRAEGLKDMTGAVLSPMDAMLMMRGIKTLEIRMERHCQNAMKVATFLENHPAVEQVMYPGLPSFNQYDLAKKQMSLFGGMIAFEVKGGIEAGRIMMNALNLVTRAVSLGDAETLIEHPASMTHATYTPEERAAHGISEGLVRMSVGLETVEDIIADIAQALDEIV
ncbi:MAG: methionine gamma-lyase [OCS116 cluster bacterium]|uniref:L-methionine gamma-lyase n=1 Tax=OCS116 cluster bacterium TaxID=2030921 RepID=A0A2A4Z1N6_9PROT|nr:methionine gamma-lyase [OCS116 cluster bacterium]